LPDNQNSTLGNNSIEFIFVVEYIIL